MLTKEDALRLFEIKDGHLVWKVAQSKKVKAGSRAGCRYPNGYWFVVYKGKKLRVHRIVWLMTYGEWPEVIDHINGDKSDNRIENLRSVNQGINQENQRKPHKNNKTGHLGVRVTASGTFQSYIVVDGKQVCLGSFKSPSEAGNAYLKAKRKMHEGCTI